MFFLFTYTSNGECVQGIKNLGSIGPRRCHSLAGIWIQHAMHKTIYKLNYTDKHEKYAKARAQFVIVSFSSCWNIVGIVVGFELSAQPLAWA